MKRYLCIDPRYDLGTPPDALVTKTIYSGVRFVVFPDSWPEVSHYLELSPNLDIQLVIARESGDPAQYMDWATSDWMRPRVSWVIGNEPDGPDGGSSWVMTPEEYQQLWDSCKGLSGARWLAGMCSGDVERARQYLQPDAAGLMVHIYTLAPVAAYAKVREYKGLGLPVRVGETYPADGYKLADYSWPVIGGVNDFCYSRAMNPDTGLYA